MPDDPVRAVPSPCVSVCRLDETSGLCTGCLRTLDEIAAWGMLGDDAKREVLKAVAERRAKRGDFANR